MVMGAPQVSSLSPPDQAYLDQLDRLAPVLAQHGMTTNLMAPGGPGAEPARGQSRRTGSGRGRLRGLLRGRQLVVLVVLGRADRGRHRAGARGRAGRARPVRAARQLRTQPGETEPQADRRAGPAGADRPATGTAGWTPRAAPRRNYGEADGRAVARPGAEDSPGKAAVRPSQVVARSAQARACAAPQARSRGSSSATMPR